MSEAPSAVPTCVKHGCKLEPITAEVGGMVVGEICPSCAAEELARQDRILFGCGVLRTYPDGRLEHIPLQQITFHNGGGTVQ